MERYWAPLQITEEETGNNEQFMAGLLLVLCCVSPSTRVVDSLLLPQG